MIVALALLAAAPLAAASDTASIDTAASAADMAPCTGVSLLFLLPPDGATDVPPASVPAVGIGASCGAGPILATLTGPDDAVQTAYVEVADDGIAWLADLALAPDSAYGLEVASGSGPEDAFYPSSTLTSSFQTGSGDVPALDGTPTVEILGQDASDGFLSVSLDLDAAGAPGWELRRDGVVVSSGTEDGPLVDGVSAAPGDEVCYLLRAYTADGQAAADSERACVTMAATACGCASSGGPGVGTTGVLLGAVGLLLRRRAD